MTAPLAVEPVTASGETTGTAAAQRCRNCGTSAAGNFCPNCGQETTLALPSAARFVTSLFGHSSAGGAAGPQAYAVLITAALLHLLPRQWEQWIGERFFRLRAWQQGAAYALSMVALMAWATDPQPFVYFRF